MPLKATGRRIGPAAKMEGEFLESVMPTRAFATLTTPGRISKSRLDELFTAWIQRVQAHNRVTLGWIKSIEPYPSRHIHATLVASVPLDCAHAEALWRMMVAPSYSEAARVAPFKHGLCGLGYVLKQLGSLGEEPQFSDNISAFAPQNAHRFYGSNAAERRQMRRISKQQRFARGQVQLPKPPSLPGS